MKELLNAGADVECQGFVDCPQDAMIKAIMGGHTTAVQLLVQSGAQRVRAQGRSFLLVAARARNTQMVDCLLQLKFSLDGGSDALLVACANGDTDIVSRLLSAGIDLNTPGKINLNTPSKVGSECTPLYQASRRGHLAIVQELLKHGADPIRELKKVSVFPSFCSNKGHLEVVRTLLEHGNVNVVEDISYGAIVSDAIAKTCAGSWSPAKAQILEILLEVASERSDFKDIWTTAISDEVVGIPVSISSSFCPGLYCA